MQPDSTWLLAALSLATHAAFAATCPQVSEIKQQPLANEGFSYTAPAPEGVEPVGSVTAQWTGGDKWAEEKDLSSYVFKGVRINEAVIDKANPANNRFWTVICQYEGEGEYSRDGEANTQMILKSTTELALTTRKAGEEAPTECGGQGKKPSDCPFN